jgi:hypothetical protein
VITKYGSIGEKWFEQNIFGPGGILSLPQTANSLNGARYIFATRRKEAYQAFFHQFMPNQCTVPKVKVKPKRAAAWCQNDFVRTIIGMHGDDSRITLTEAACEKKNRG